MISHILSEAILCCLNLTRDLDVIVINQVFLC
jgi:hypothetical protein